MEVRPRVDPFVPIHVDRDSVEEADPRHTANRKNDPGGPRTAQAPGTIGGPINAESTVIPGNPIQPKSAPPSVYAETADDCHAEGRGFESHQPLSVMSRDMCLT